MICGIAFLACPPTQASAAAAPASFRSLRDRRHRHPDPDAALPASLPVTSVTAADIKRRGDPVKTSQPPRRRSRPRSNVSNGSTHRHLNLRGLGSNRTLC